MVWGRGHVLRILDSRKGSSPLTAPSFMGPWCNGSTLNDGYPAKDTDSNLFNFHYEGKGPGSNPGGSTSLGILTAKLSNDR